MHYWHGCMQTFSLSLMWESFRFSRKPRGAFTSRLKTDISCFKPSLSLRTKHEKRPRSFSCKRGGLLSEVSTMRRLEKVFEAKVDKAAAAEAAGSSRGHISAARTDPSTPDPPDKQHFLSQALRTLLWRHFPPHFKD